MRTSILVLASVLIATTAHAEQVGIVVTGDANLQPQLTSQIERWLHDRGHSIVPGALEPEAINSLIDCFVLDDAGCAHDVVRTRSRADSIVYARVDQSTKAEGSLEVSINGFVVRKDRESSSERRTCALCTDLKLVAMVEELMLALLPDVPPVSPAAAESNRVPASSTPHPNVFGEATSSRRLLPYGLIGAGGLALVGGIVMIAVDEDPDPAGTQQPTYRDTATTGTIVGALGAAALGVGCYLWFSDRPSSTPVAAVARDGGFVGWIGSF
jgi:hypothetical protein